MSYKIAYTSRLLGGVPHWSQGFLKTQYSLQLLWGFLSLVVVWFNWSVNRIYEPAKHTTWMILVQRERNLEKQRLCHKAEMGNVVLLWLRDLLEPNTLPVCFGYRADNSQVRPKMTSSPFCVSYCLPPWCSSWHSCCSSCTAVASAPLSRGRSSALTFLRPCLSTRCPISSPRCPGAANRASTTRRCSPMPRSSPCVCLHHMRRPPWRLPWRRLTLSSLQTQCLLMKRARCRPAAPNKLPTEAPQPKHAAQR